MGMTIEENKDNDLKYRHGLNGPIAVGGDTGNRPDYTNGQPMTEGGNQAEKLEYFTE